MSQVLQALIRELEQEGASTRRVLQRVPEDQFAWKPHAKSKSLGQLALHVANIPGAVSRLLLQEGLDARSAKFDGPSAESREQLLTTLDQGLADAKQNLNSLSEEKLFAPWKMKDGERVVFEMPTIAVARNIMLNHWYHHRGQLTVYLRFLDVPLPSVYGPTADDNPFLK